MKTSLVIASSFLVSSLLALAQTSVLYQEDWGSTNGGSSLESVGWSEIPPPTTWSGTFARENYDGSTDQPLRGSTIKAWWFDPRAGKANLIGEFPNTQRHEFTPPDVGEALDWVLVLADAAMKFPPPGLDVPDP